MQSVLILLSFISSLIIGTGLLLYLLKDKFQINGLLLLSLGLPLGFGLVSCLFFFWIFLFPSARLVYFVLESSLALVILIFVFRHPTLIRAWFRKPEIKNRLIFYTFGTAFLILFIIGVSTFINYTIVDPHGRYDAWAIWNVRARMIVRGNEFWKTVFVPQVFHADYPLLLPLTTARTWIFASTESTRPPALIAGLFTFLLTGLLVGALAKLRSWSQGWLAGSILISTPWIIWTGSKQFADIPLAVYMLAAAVCLALVSRKNAPSRIFLWLGCAFAALAGWTKNEGLTFFVFYLLIVIIYFVKNKYYGAKITKSDLYGLLAAALPLVTIVVFKLTLAPPNDLIDQSRISQLTAYALDLSRVNEVWRVVYTYPSFFGGLSLQFLVVFGVYFFLARPAINRKNNQIVVALTMLVTLQFLTYLFMYLITPQSIQTHIYTSFDRVLMQIYPMILFGVFLITTPLEELLVRTHQPFPGEHPTTGQYQS